MVKKTKAKKTIKRKPAKKSPRVKSKKAPQVKAKKTPQVKAKKTPRAKSRKALISKVKKKTTTRKRRSRSPIVQYYLDEPVTRAIAAPITRAIAAENNQLQQQIAMPLEATDDLVPNTVGLDGQTIDRDPQGEQQTISEVEQLTGTATPPDGNKRKRTPQSASTSPESDGPSSSKRTRSATTLCSTNPKNQNSTNDHESAQGNQDLPPPIPGHPLAEGNGNEPAMEDVTVYDNVSDLVRQMEEECSERSDEHLGAFQCVWNHFKHWADPFFKFHFDL